MPCLFKYPSACIAVSSPRSDSTICTCTVSTFPSHQMSFFLLGRCCVVVYVGRMSRGAARHPVWYLYYLFFCVTYLPTASLSPGPWLVSQIDDMGSARAPRGTLGCGAYRSWNFDCVLCVRLGWDISLGVLARVSPGSGG